MNALAKSNSNCKQQTHLLFRENVTLVCKSSVEKIAGRDSQGTWRQNEMIEAKPPIAK
jgi:hypothetical protein